jgi:Carboxypeptidase regulatory-like domain
MTVQTASRRLAPVAIALAFLALAVSSAFAQNTSGSLTGTVVDPSGAVVVGADITLTNEASRDIRRTKSNADGYFTFAAVPPSTYSVSIETPGFSKYEQKGIALRIGASQSLRTIKLDVAGMAEEATVMATVDLAPLNSGEKSATLTSEQILNFSTVGRSAAELLKVLPGLTPATGVNNRPNFSGEVIGINGNGEGGQQSAAGNYSANGTRVEALDITVDGAPGADPGCNCATSVNPNSEMVAEFKVLQSNFGAEHAKGPVAMTVVSKQGGRDFHGTLYTYLRDYHLNSNEWFANKVGSERVKNKFLYPGFNVSGPVLIPGTNFNKNRDKVFFFLGYERFQQKLDTGFVKSWVPTDAMRNGDFSQAANLGLSGGFVNTVPNFPGGIVPSNLIDPGGRALLNVFPKPNADPSVTGGYNYVDNLVVDQNGTQLLGRVDFNISDNTKMFVRYNRQREVQPFVIGLWWRNGERQVPYPSSISAPNKSDSYTASLTHVFNPTLTNEVVLGYTFIDFPNTIDDRSKVSRQALGYPYQGVFGQSNDQIPSVDAGGWGNNGPLYYNPGGFDPVLYATKWQFSASDNLTKVWGTHTFKGGLYYEHVINKQPGNGDSNGLIELATWDGSSSGNTFADLLTGHGTNYQETSKNVVHNMSYNLFEGYVQDSWKMKPRLTVDYGVRIAYEGPWTDRNGIGMAVFDPSIYSATAPGSTFPGVTWTAKDPNIPLSGTQKPPVYFTPRVGFAYDVKGTGSTVIRGGFGIYRYHEPQAIYSGLLDLPAGFRSTSVGSAYQLSSLDSLGGGNVVFNGQTIALDDKKQPVTYSWSATLNQRLPWSMNLEIGYVGNSQKDLRNEGVANYNPVPIGAMINDPNGDPNAYRLLPNYGDLTVFRHSLYSNYHGIQSLLSRQRGKFNFTLAYTFSKSLGIRAAGSTANSVGSEYLRDTSGNLVDFRSFNYGVSSLDRSHVLTASYSWQLGNLKQGGFANAILGGWQITGISTYISGAPLQAATNTNFSMAGTLADGSDINAQRVSGSPTVPAQPLLTCDPTSNVPSGYYFNPACFAAPTAGNNGNFIFPYIKGQAYTNHDLSLFKNFGIGTKGQKLQFRVSAYNVLNHPIAFPDAATNLTLNFTNGVLSNPEFAKKNEDNKFGRRIIQLALRYSF